MESELTSNSISQVYTVKSVAERLKGSQSKVRQLVRENRIPYFRIDGSVRFHEPEIREWILSLTSFPTNQPPQDEVDLSSIIRGSRE